MDIYFHLFAVMYNAAVKWKSLFKILISILSDKCHVMGSVDQMGEPPTLFWANCTILYSHQQSTMSQFPLHLVVFRDWQECMKFALVMSDTLRFYGLYPTRILCPWGFPGKDTGVSCHALLQGIFLTQGLNQHILYLLNWQVGSLSLVPPGSPLGSRKWKNFCSISRVPATWDRKFLEVLCTILSLKLTVLYCIHKFHTANSCSVACLFWDPMNFSPTGSSAHRISQARKLDWVVISSSRVSSLPRSNRHLLGRQILYHWATREALKQECTC